MRDLRETKAFLLLILGIGLLLLVLQRLDREKLVVYCAHDAVFAEGVLAAFTRETGIELAVRYDTEATKSLGLAEQIIREGEKPRCDVFWNNEILGTLDLARRGLLEPHRGNGWQRIPSQWRDAEGLWAGFAARLRVTIHNPAAGLAPDPWAAGADLSRFAIAKPLYGTTLTHYSALWHHWGAERLKAWHADARQRGLQEVQGNAAVKTIVAAGTCIAGWTDTDDAFDALDQRAAVTMEPATIEDGRTILIPNTVAVVRGAKRGDHARLLVDYLLSQKTELALARSKARQIPLGAVDPAALPEEVRGLLPALARTYPVTELLDARNECLAWLKSVYLR